MCCFQVSIFALLLCAFASPLSAQMTEPTPTMTPVPNMTPGPVAEPDPEVDDSTNPDNQSLASLIEEMRQATSDAQAEVEVAGVSLELAENSLSTAASTASSAGGAVGNDAAIQMQQHIQNINTLRQQNSQIHQQLEALLQELSGLSGSSIDP
jgi:methionine synthase II (cobalamin-independent)